MFYIQVEEEYLFLMLTFFQCRVFKQKCIILPLLGVHHHQVWVIATLYECLSDVWVHVAIDSLFCVLNDGIFILSILKFLLLYKRMGLLLFITSRYF